MWWDWSRKVSFLKMKKVMIILIILPLRLIYEWIKRQKDIILKIIFSMRIHFIIRVQWLLCLIYLLLVAYLIVLFRVLNWWYVLNYDLLMHVYWQLFYYWLLVKQCQFHQLQTASFLLRLTNVLIQETDSKFWTLEQFVINSLGKNGLEFKIMEEDIFGSFNEWFSDGTLVIFAYSFWWFIHELFSKVSNELILILFDLEFILLD